jgi:ketosteroid isomerase-like protein
MNETETRRDPEVQEMLDKAAIREVLWRYCRGVDRRDADIVSSCYHPDAYDDHVGNVYSGETVGQGLVDWMNEIMIKTSHNITTNTIVVKGDVAGSESYTTSMHIMKGEGEDQHTMLSVARYVDRFERRGGEWRISSRLVVAEFSGWAEMQMFPFDSLARHDTSDPSYEVLGL